MSEQKPAPLSTRARAALQRAEKLAEARAAQWTGPAGTVRRDCQWCLRPFAARGENDVVCGPCKGSRSYKRWKADR